MEIRNTVVPMDWRKLLISLREQFEAASLQCPYLRHRMLAAGLEDAAMLNQPFERAQQSGRLVLLGLDVLRTPSFRMLNVQHLYTVTSDQYRDISGLERFRELAVMAADALLQMPDPVRSTFDPPTEPHPDAGILNALWLGLQWVAVNRESLIAEKERVAATGGDVSSFIIPERDGVIWRNSNCNRDARWCLALHNLAWRLADAAPFKAVRSTWVKDNVSFDLSLPPEHWRQALTMGGLWSNPGLDLPLRWVQSELQANVFLCSVWAIDLLLAHSPDEHEMGRGVELSLPAECLPDEEGYVQKPLDDGAYVLATDVLNEYIPRAWGALTHKQLSAMLAKHPTIRRWKPRKQRLFVHLGDWGRFTKANPERPQSGIAATSKDPSPEEIEELKAEIRRANPREKVRKSIAGLLPPQQQNDD